MRLKQRRRGSRRLDGNMRQGEQAQPRQTLPVSSAKYTRCTTLCASWTITAT